MPRADKVVGVLRYYIIFGYVGDVGCNIYMINLSSICVVISEFGGLCRASGRCKLYRRGPIVSVGRRKMVVVASCDCSELKEYYLVYPKRNS